MEEAENGADSSAVTDCRVDMSQKISESFASRNYSLCLSHLKKIQDSKLVLNTSIVSFYASNFANVDELTSNLNKLCNQAEVRLYDIDSLDSVRNSYIYFSHAILLYHSMRYSSAFAVLNKMFTYIESLDNVLKRGVTLLLTEVFLRVHQPERALAVVCYVENLLNQSSMFSDEQDLTDSPSRNNISDSDMETFKLKLKEYKCKCGLSLRNLEKVSQDLTQLSTESDKINLWTSIYSAEMNAARARNMRANIRFLNAYSDYLRGDFKSAVRNLASISPENTFPLTGDSVPMALYNNLGCIHLYIGKPSLSINYFRKALQENKKNRERLNSSERNQCVFTMGGNKLPMIMYNLGISLLCGGKPIQAFDCLTLAVQVYHMNPRLWLRLAECCIMVHKNGNERDFDFINRRKEVLREVVGFGAHRKLILNLNLFENNKYSYDAQSFAIPDASLEFATLCLRNSLLLLSGSIMDFSPSNPISAVQLLNLKTSVFTCSAYVSLCLGDPIVAVNNCRNVLNMSDCSNTHRVLAYIYIAEAYVLLDRIPEALEHLKINLDCYPLQQDSMKMSRYSSSWKPFTTASAQTVFQFNLAVVLALRGDLPKAADLLKKVWMVRSPLCEIPVQVVSLALYIELSLGHAEIARNIIKQNCPQYKV